MLIVAELLQGKPRKTTLSAVTFGRQVAQATGGAFDMLVVGEGAGGAARELASLGARTLFVAEIGGVYVCERYAATVAAVAQKCGAGVVAATASSYGKDLLPRVAAKLDAAIASDIVGVKTDGGTLHYRRSMYAGNVFAWCTLSTPVQAVTVRQAEFEAASPAGGTSAIEEVGVAADPAASRIEGVSLSSVKSERPELAEADTVVAGGRALKSADGFKTVLEPLADALRAAIGASRAACDAGYVSSDLQVGQTGKVVAPKLYIAVGISGAIQHLAGMKGSKTIVAINKDKEAPIAQIADYFLAEDLFTAVPALTEAVRKIKAG